MLEIRKVIKEKYNIYDINYIYIDINNQILEFNLNAFNTVKISKIDNNYHLILSILNSNAIPTKRININIKYNSYEKLINDLECFNFNYL